MSSQNINPDSLSSSGNKNNQDDVKGTSGSVSKR